MNKMKILKEDVRYVMIVNMPTEEELKASVAKLMETQGRTLPQGHSRRQRRCRSHTLKYTFKMDNNFVILSDTRYYIIVEFKLPIAR